MKKKLMSLMLVIMVCIVSLAACGGGDDKGNGGNDSQGGGSAANNSSDNASASGYSFEYKGTSISVNTDIDPIVEKIGEPSSKFEAPSCAGQGTDFIYTYSGFEIDTSPFENITNAIAAIIIVSDEVETPEGITIGSTKEDVEAAYGTDYTESNGMMTYQKGDMKLNILIKNNAVDSIQYVSNTLS